jgi:prepilin peptidase CpaA
MSSRDFGDTGGGMISHYGFMAILLYFPAGMALAASLDLITMTIPNRLCLALALGFLVFAAITRAPMEFVLTNLSCGAVVLVAMFAMFSLGWIGGGDAKLAAATALWLGWSSLLDYSLSAAIYGGALTILLIFARKAPLPQWLSRQAWIARLHNPKTGVPYGIALAAAGIMVYPQTALWRALAVA